MSGAKKKKEHDRTCGLALRKFAQTPLKGAARCAAGKELAASCERPWRWYP